MACLIFSRANHSLQSWVRKHLVVRKECLRIFGASGRKINCATQSPLILIFLKVFTQHACHQNWQGLIDVAVLQLSQACTAAISSLQQIIQCMMAKIEIEGIDLPEQNTC
jgi:hypothetical protein